MTLKTTKLRDAITFVLAAGVLGGSGAAFAQDQTPPKKTDEIDRITVTGSRIKRVEAETQQPVFSLNREDIQAQGLTSIGDVIQNITANGATLNTMINNGGNGETRVSLRNLGSNRTLVLVNGRRWVGGTGLGGAVDLNTIPSAAVERIEVLKDGASSIYGSDAISGVVNVILRNDYQGAEANAYLGVSSYGDGFRQSYDFTVGSANDRFSAMFGANYVKEDPVMAGDRELSAVPTYGTGVTFGSSTVPGGRYALCTGVINPISGVCSVAETRPNGTAGQFTYDPGKSGLNWRNRTGADFYNFAPENYLLTPQERTSIFSRATLDLTDNVMAYMNAVYNNRKSEQLLASMPIVLGSGPGAGTQAKTVSISKDNIYNPFGAPVSRIQRRARETGGRSFNQNVNTYAFGAGLEGSFDFADRFFSWDAGLNYGRNSQSDTTYGLFNIPSLKAALGPSMIVNGKPICVSVAGNAASIIPGCVPMNLLGNIGSITKEMLDYTTFVAHDNSGYTMKQYFANISGELFELPGGMFGFAAGVEHREESGFDDPDAFIASGNTTGNARKPTSGKYSLNEAYLELALPVLKDVPFARELEFSIATRYSKYSNFGNTLNSKFGFKWRPIEDLLVRGNWAQGFRAPSISELYAGLGDSFPGVSDPCTTQRWGSLAPDAQARCVAQGVPNGGYDQGNPQIRISVGGNPNLMPEKSISRTLGLVYNPGWLNGFDISLDWWNIHLRDTISGFGAQDILDGCIIRNNPNFCALYSRNPGGQIADLLSAGVNFGSYNLEGFDSTINYRLPETAFGKFSFTLDSTYMSKYMGDDQRQAVGRPQTWRLRSNLMARWERGDWGATWGARYYSDFQEDCQTMVDYGFANLCSEPDRWVSDGHGGSVQEARNHIGATTYHDAAVYFKAPWNAKVTLGVQNVFAKDPPRSVNATNSFYYTYELPGRFLYLQYNQKF